MYNNLIAVGAAYDDTTGGSDTGVLCYNSIIYKQIIRKIDK